MNKHLRGLLLRILMRCNKIFSDERYLKMLFYLAMGYHLDMNNPQTMNEKLQWLKIHQRDDKFTKLVDKLKVKDEVSRLIGSEYVAQVLGVWTSPEEIDFDSLPNRFVLKTNHSGGNTGVIICHDKSHFDICQARHKMAVSLKTDIYPQYREWPYKNVEKKIFAEEYLGKNLIDYKFYCFDGDVDCVMVCLERQEGESKFYFFDREWNLLRINSRGKAAPKGFTIPKPKNIDRLFELASIMSKGFPFVRMDFYDIDGKCYFGEYTFYPASGFDPNYLPETDRYFGEKIHLTKI